MRVVCTVLNYEKDGNNFTKTDSPVYISDAFSEQDMVNIQINETTAKVDGKELIEAARRCMKTQYPY